MRKREREQERECELRIKICEFRSIFSYIVMKSLNEEYLFYLETKMVCARCNMKYLCKLILFMWICTASVELYISVKQQSL